MSPYAPEQLHKCTHSEAPRPSQGVAFPAVDDRPPGECVRLLYLQFAFPQLPLNTLLYDYRKLGNAIL